MYSRRCHHRHPCHADAVRAEVLPSTAGSVRAWLVAVAIIVLAAIVCAVVVELPSHAASDVTHYKYWARQVSTYGVAGAYSGTYPETAAIYPPVTMYGYRVAGWFYRRFFDPSFDMQAALASHALTVLIKLVAVVPHLAGSLAIFYLLFRRHGARPALFVTALIVLNPAAIIDVAYWGQPDMFHAMFLVIAVYLFEEDRPYAGFVFVGLAAATKPQAWALLPFLGYVAVRRFGLVTSLRGGLVAAAAAAVLCLPYLLYGTAGDLLTLPRLIAETMPVVSANAHNVWWLVTNGKPDFVLDSEPLLGALTYRYVAIVLTLVVFGYGLWRTDPFAGQGELSMIAAYMAFGWFLVTTRAHENHAFFALPLLVMAAPRSRTSLVIYGLISLTLFLNVVLHDFGLETYRLSLLTPDALVRIQLANAALNVTVFLAWSVYLWHRRAGWRTGPGWPYADGERRDAPIPAGRGAFHERQPVLGSAQQELRLG